MMETPFTLATLPQLLDTKHGKIRLSPVLRLQGSLKRKRHEIALGIDGESVNIYSVNAQSQALHSSYALPPQSYLCCPPVSVYTDAPAQRDTFTVLRNGPHDQKRRLVRHTERLHESIDLSQPVKNEYKLKDGEVLGVEALQAETLAFGTSPRALVTYKDGTILCIDESMSKTTWTHSILETNDAGASLEYATFIEPSAARKGLFRRRDDLLSTLESVSTDRPLLGCFIMRRSRSLLLRLCIINTSRMGCQHLDDLQLSEQHLAANWYLHAEAGQLYCLTNGLLTFSDLSGLVPELNTVIRDRRAPIEAFSVLSASTVVSISENRMALHDSKYGSDQGSIILEDAVTSGRKRKRDSVGLTQRPELCCFPSAGTIVLVSSNLTGVQLNSDFRELQSTRSNTTLLSEVLGKGIAKHLTHTADDEDSIALSELDWYKQVDELIAGGNTTGLEQLIQQNFGFEQAGDMDGLWALADAACDLGPKRYRRALVILERLFVPVQSALDNPARLHLRLMSRNTIHWLVRTGVLTSRKLTAVLGVAITDVHIADALGSADPSFQLLQDILSTSIHLPAPFAVECLRLLIRSLDSSTSPSLLTIDAPESVDMQDAEVEQESRSAEKELSNALTALQSGLETRSETMRHIFDRLHAIPHTLLAKHLRAGLEQQDLLFFIHLLRMELADAGWTGRYIDMGTVTSDSIEDESSPADNAIRTIGQLLIAAVDAIGTAGWLVGATAADNENHAILDALRAEISASVEGAYEAHALQSQLNELERYAHAHEMKIIREPRRQTQRGVIEVTSSSFGDPDFALPMGGRSSVINAKEDHKARGGMTGLYQFERIRV